MGCFRYFLTAIRSPDPAGGETGCRHADAGAVVFAGAVSAG